MFDEKKNNVIEFGEFVHALSVFHPKAPLAEKAECALPPHAARLHAGKASDAASAALRCTARRSVARSAVAPLALLTLLRRFSPPCVAPVAFRIYDLGNTGAIDRSEVRTMLKAMLKEDAVMALPEAALERIIDSTFAVAAKEVGLSQDDSIGPGEWLAFVNKMPNILGNMTLPVLRELTTAFPSFVLNSVASTGEMTSLVPGNDESPPLKPAPAAAAAR